MPGALVPQQQRGTLLGVRPILSGFFGQFGLEGDLVLPGLGAITAIPLIIYVAASRLLPLTTPGLVFYIGPAAQLLVAVMVFKEPVMEDT